MWSDKKKTFASIVKNKSINKNINNKIIIEKKNSI